MRYSDTRRRASTRQLSARSAGHPATPEPIAPLAPATLAANLTRKPTVRLRRHVNPRTQEQPDKSITLVAAGQRLHVDARQLDALGAHALGRRIRSRGPASARRRSAGPCPSTTPGWHRYGMSQPAFMCSRAAHERDDSMVATAPGTALGCSSSRKARGRSTPSTPSPPTSPAASPRALAAADARVSLIRRPGRHSREDRPIRWAFADVRPSNEGIRWGEAASAADLLDMPWEVSPGEGEPVAIVCAQPARRVLRDEGPPSSRRALRISGPDGSGSARI